MYVSTSGVDEKGRPVRETLRDRVEKTIDFLPPLPAVMADLIQALKNDDIDLRVLSKIIGKDPSMTMNVLKIANSAFYALPNKVSTIDQAVRLLGLSEITTLCISCGAYQSLKPPRGKATLDLKAFWRHSIATGVIAKILCRKFNLGTWDSLYLAGLIHDVGKVILDRLTHESYDELVELTYAENISILEAERRVLGASHDTVGGWLMEKWKLPQVFVETARSHHSLETASPEDRTVVAIISLADQFARLKGHGFGGDRTGVIVSEFDAFSILLKTNPDLADFDVVKFVLDLDDTTEEIEEMEKIVGSR